jgi:hypothetical protein
MHMQEAQRKNRESTHISITDKNMTAKSVSQMLIMRTIHGQSDDSACFGGMQVIERNGSPKRAILELSSAILCQA